MTSMANAPVIVGEFQRQGMKCAEKRQPDRPIQLRRREKEVLISFLVLRHKTAQDKAYDADDEGTPEGGLEPLHAEADMQAFRKP